MQQHTAGEVEIFVVYTFSQESTGERILKIGPHLPQLQSNIKAYTFLRHSVCTTVWYLQTKSLPSPHGCDDTKELDFFESTDTYSISKCRLERQAKSLDRTCGCIAPYMPGIFIMRLTVLIRYFFIDQLSRSAMLECDLAQLQAACQFVSRTLIMHQWMFLPTGSPGSLLETSVHTQVAGTPNSNRNPGNLRMENST